MNNNGAPLLKSNTTTCLFQIPFPPCISLLHSRRRCLLSIQLPKHKKILSFHVKLPSSSSSSSVFSSKTPPTGTEAFEFEEEDEDVIVPLSNMRQWSRNKPRGFGEGRVYDTSLEDKLLEELEQSRVANIKNDENNTKHKEAEMVPTSGIRVRLVNLPKKKNIHRDLQTAFKPFTGGIINILPAVSGNEKTREPVCKGFAFVDFKSHKEANRFVDTFSTQPITFGKVQKQIRCEIMKSNTAASVTSSVHRIERSPLPVLNATMAINSNPVTETPLDPCVEDAAFDTMKIGDDDLVSATEDYYSFGKLNNVAHEAQVGSESLKKQVVVREKGKKKKKKTPKLNIPGSAANRLKMKEKALLSGVFSKYGGKSSD